MPVLLFWFVRLPEYYDSTVCTSQSTLNSILLFPGLFLQRHTFSKYPHPQVFISNPLPLYWSLYNFIFWIQQKARKCLWLLILLLYIHYIRGRLRSETHHFKEIWKVKFLYVCRFLVPCRLCNVRTGLTKNRRTGNSGFCFVVPAIACQFVHRLQ